MLLAIAVAGLVAGFITGLIGAFILRGELFGFGGLVGALVGLLIGYPIGVIAGIVLANRVFRYTGSRLLGIIGSLLGAILTFLLAEYFGLNSGPLFMFFLVAVPLLGTAGYHLRRSRR